MLPVESIMAGVILC